MTMAQSGAMHQYRPVQDPARWNDKNDIDSNLDEEEFRTIELGRPRRPTPCWRSILSTCTYLLVAVAALVVIGVEAHRAGWTEERSIVPKFNTEMRSLRPLPSYEQPSNEESDHLWNSKLPNEKGFMSIDDAAAYGLPPGLSNFDNHTTKYGVTWAHEYHCLAMTRDEFWKAIAGSSTLYNGDKEDNDLAPAEKKRLKHIAHCFDYIRQLIMCRGDMTIEWGADETDDANGVPDHIDGYGIPHKCVKFDEMYDWMQARPAKPAPDSHHH